MGKIIITDVYSLHRDEGFQHGLTDKRKLSPVEKNENSNKMHLKL